MSYFLIALVVMVALSPLISAMPSRRQRQIADLRQAAVVTGLFVQYRQSPLEPADAPPRVFYGRHRSREDASVGGEISYRREQASGASVKAQWTSVRGAWSPPTLELLNSLPPGISLACEDLQGVGVFWDEQGQAQDVENINGVLKGMLAKRD